MRTYIILAVDFPKGGSIKELNDTFDALDVIPYVSEHYFLARPIGVAAAEAAVAHAVTIKFPRKRKRRR